MRWPPVVMLAVAALLAGTVRPAGADTRLRIMPPPGATVAVGQRFDLRVEATGDTEAPRDLVVTLDGKDISTENVLAPGPDGELGAGGTGTAPFGGGRVTAAAPANTTNLLVRDLRFSTPGRHEVVARTGDGATVSAVYDAAAWQSARPGARPARNIILLVGDGMGIAHRTAARIVSRGQTYGKTNAPLAMDTLGVTGLVMTSSLNATITDSAPGMSSYATGHKANNNHVGVYPDNTPDHFDNPRVEYIGELLKRTRGRGFNVGLVTTAAVIDATPAGNAVHTSFRDAYYDIATRLYDERAASGITVLMGGGATYFSPAGAGGTRKDGRDLVAGFRDAGFEVLRTGADVRAALAGAPPKAVLGLFHPTHMSVAFDRVGAGRYSDELALPKNAAVRDQPSLPEMTSLALATLSATSPRGFYLMVEGASIDKQAHESDADRTIWDTIEFDNAVKTALDFARRTNEDADPANDTLVVVTADHESGGFGIIGVGNERYAPAVIGRSVRDYAATFRFLPAQTLNFFTNYTVDAQGFPTDPDPTKKLLVGFAAGPDRNENWLSNRLAQVGTVVDPVSRIAVANPGRDGPSEGSDNRAVDGRAYPGFLVPGTIENGATGCQAADGCPDDTRANPVAIAGHTASDVPLSAEGPGAWQFTGVYENTDVFVKLLRAAAGTYPRLPR
ncbi:MAG: alkaline phosphatase [Vicinamibacterales bacterium]